MSTLLFERQYGQWTVRCRDDGYEIFNPATDGTRLYYVCESGAYGNPVLTPEPDKALDPPATRYVDVRGNPVSLNGKISGVICQGPPGQPAVHRFSFSNPNAPQCTLHADGSIEIDGVRWHLIALFQKDKNRIKNYDAFYDLQPRGVVKVVELGDLQF